MERWYAVMTKPRQESQALEHLERQSFQAWLPRLERELRIRGRWQTRIEPLFPRYLFLRGRAGVDDFSTVRSTRGVSDFVRFGVEPAIVPDQVIEYLQETADPDTGIHHLGQSARRFKSGDRVLVLEGPFAGLEGVLLQEKGEDRVIVLLSILGGQRNVAMSPENLVRQGS